MKRRWWTTGLGVTALPLALLLGACGGGGGGDSVASLGGESASGARDGEDGGDEPTEQETQDAFRRFAQCMREHGIDMPDPQFDEDGGGVMITASPAEKSAEANPEQFEEADQACRKHLEGVIDARERNLDPEQEREMQERALAFAECMREHGIDMPDPQFEEGGSMTQRLGPGDVDPNDPAFEEAHEECADETGMPVPGKAGRGERIGIAGAPDKSSQ